MAQAQMEHVCDIHKPTILEEGEGRKQDYEKTFRWHEAVTVLVFKVRQFDENIRSSIPAELLESVQAREGSLRKFKDMFRSRSKFKVVIKSFILCSSL